MSPDVTERLLALLERAVVALEGLERSTRPLVRCATCEGSGRHLEGVPTKEGHTMVADRGPCRICGGRGIVLGQRTP